MSCDGVFQNEDFNCDEPLQPGVDEELILINHDDILSVTFNTSPDENVIKTITLKNGAVAHRFQGFKNSNNPQMDLVDNEFTPFSYDHTCNFLVFNTGQSTKDNLEQMKVKKQLAIVKNADKTFEVYGLNLGLEMLSLTRSPGGQANGGAFLVQLKTADGAAKESKLPQNMLDTDFATTDAAIQSLLNVPSIINIDDLSVSTAGGDTVVVTGTNFFDTAAVPADNVTSVDWINDATQAVTNEPTFTTDSDTQLTISSTVALAAANYRLRITTNDGVALSPQIVVAS